MPNDNDISCCAWANDALLIQYHDTVYGRPRKSDTALFAKFCLEGFQAGLSWRTVLAKQPAFERAFCGFDPWRCAELSDAYLDFLMQDAGIIRNRRKIYAVRQNAQALLWHYPAPGDFRRLVYSGILPETLSRQLKQQSFCFCGPTICESFLMSVGAIEAHEPGCALFGTHAAPLP